MSRTKVFFFYRYIYISNSARTHYPIRMYDIVIKRYTHTRIPELSKRKRVTINQLKGVISVSKNRIMYFHRNSSARKGLFSRVYFIIIIILGARRKTPRKCNIFRNIPSSPSSSPVSAHYTRIFYNGQKKWNEIIAQPRRMLMPSIPVNVLDSRFHKITQRTWFTQIVFK